MAQISLDSTEEVPVMAAKAERATRLFFLDHLRAGLVILVVLHHVAMVYGASAPFYYVEPPFTAPEAFRVLLVFALVNQAWFMGAFFLLAGYFTPGSFDRKGSRSFLKDRLIRLGIPLIFFTFVLNPLSVLGMYLMPATLTGISEPLTWESFWQMYPDLIGLGPLWFIAMLLVFSCGYVVWRWLTKNRAAGMRSESSTLTYLGVGIFILALAAASFLFRMIVPLGESVSVVVDALSFPTLAYLPQYIIFFLAGMVAFRRDWLRTLPNSMGVAGFVAAVAAFVVLFSLAFSGQVLSFELTEALQNAMGNGHWQSAVYALWDSIFAVGMCLAAISFFHRFLNKDSRFGRFLSQQSYAVYIIHIPIIVLLGYLLRDIGFDGALGPVLKFGLAAIIVVPICFAVATVIRRIPGVSRVL